MAGTKRKEKAQELRTEIQQKSKITREELGNRLSTGISDEQLDSRERALAPKSRISKLSFMGASKALDKRFIKAEDFVSQRPPLWHHLLGQEFTVDDWEMVTQGLEVVQEHVLEPVNPVAVAKMNEHRVKAQFYTRCYEDDEMMKLIQEAYAQGVERGVAEASGKNSPPEKLKAILEIQQRIIDFMLVDLTEQVDPVITLSPRDLVDRVTMYFVECDLVKKFYTVPGLAFYLGFANRDEFFSYIDKNKNSILVYILKRAITYIEAERLVDMMYGGGMMAGHKLDLATNFNYNDAGKKSEAPVSQTNITVNNNKLNMGGMPPRPKDMVEWQSWYTDHKKAISGAEGCDTPLDVTPE